MMEPEDVIPDYVEGIRVTGYSVSPSCRTCLTYVQTQRRSRPRRMFLDENLKFVAALEKLGTRAPPITSGGFTADYLLDKDEYGLVARSTCVDARPLEAAIRAGTLPIFTSLAESPAGQILNVNADTAAGELAKEREPLKIVVLDDKGGLFHGVTGERLDVVHLDEEYDDRMKQPWLRFGTKLKLRGSCSRSSSVAVISANSFQQELFTDSGAARSSGAATSSPSMTRRTPSARTASGRSFTTAIRTSWRGLRA
jgi:N-acetyl-gamma-glutamyl-phosphate reductase/acetylglutamate kinase